MKGCSKKHRVFFGLLLIDINAIFDINIFLKEMNVSNILFIISEEISFGTDLKLEMPESMFKNGPKM